MMTHPLQTSARGTLPPIVGVCTNPLLGFRPSDMYAVRPGATLRELAPQTDRPLLCRQVGVDGHPDGYLLRADWDHPVRPGEIFLFEVDPPQGKDFLRTALMIALFIAANAIAPGSGLAMIAARTAIVVVGSMIINEALPANAPELASQQAASPTYSTSLSGNAARLYQPVPKICGRHRITPPFAAQPYTRFDDAGDQFYYALFAVGVGEHDLERELIDDTALSHFQDVTTRTYLAPGEAPATVLANVVTSIEVGSQELVTGQTVGGYAACGPRKLATQIECDVLLNGLGVQSGGGVTDKSVVIRFLARKIDEFGAATSPWWKLGDETLTEATTAAVRRTFTYPLGTAARVEVSAMRVDEKDEALGTLNSPVWGGLRCVLSEAAPLNPNVAHYEIVMRASEQLNGLTQRQIALILRAHCRSWHPDTGWAAPAHTRNGAWWCVDLATDPVWGLGYADDMVDLPSFYELSLTAAARQDRFDYVFDASMNGWDALQLIARSMRARVFRRNGVITVARDQAEDLPVTAFSSRNTQPGSMKITERLLTGKTPDGVIVEYFDNRAWDWLEITCPCPGFTAAEVDNPVRMRLAGITGAKHAEREGLYEAAVIGLRTRTAKCTTEMQGMLPSYLCPVRWMPDMQGYGQTGDVAFWDPATLVLGLTEPPVFAASNYLRLMRPDGTLTDPVAVTPGPTPHDVVLPEAPDFDLVLDSGTQDRPIFLFGPLTTSDELVKITRISDGGRSEAPEGVLGAQLWALEAIVDDDGVHSADAHLLPGPGDVQDPVDVAADSEGGYEGSVFDIVTLTDNTVHAGNSANNADIGTVSFAEFGLRPDATAYGRTLSGFLDDNDSGEVDLAGQWLRGVPLDPVHAAGFQVRVDLEAGAAPEVGTLGAWEGLDTLRVWRLTKVVGASLDYNVVSSLRMQIRDVATETVQADRVLTLSFANAFSGF